MRKNSETFAAMYKDLDQRKEIFTYNTTKKTGGDSRDPYVMNIGLNYTGNSDYNEEDTYEHAQMSLIAHETAHKFRDQYGLDPPFPKSINQGIDAKDYSNWNNYFIQFQKAHETSERGALHIENIVRSELTRSGKFGTMQIHQYYSPGFYIKSELDKEMGIKKTAFLIHYYDLFDNGKYSKEYYDRKIKIYEELGIIKR